LIDDLNSFLSNLSRANHFFPLVGGFAGLVGDVDLVGGFVVRAGDAALVRG
jgi:hypothetical protein